MTDQTRQRELARAERYRQRQWLAKRGKAGAADRDSAFKFDESGFRVAQRDSSFVRRVARLLKPL